MNQRVKILIINLGHKESEIQKKEIEFEDYLNSGWKIYNDYIANESALVFILTKEEYDI